MDADDRTFIRELLRRHEKATDAMVNELNALTRRVEAGTDQFVAQMEAQRREFSEENRAQRAALFRIFDRLDEGGSAAGA
jgi:hypothetical protein